MSKAALLGFNSAEGRGTIMHSEDGQTRIETRQDVTGLLDAISEMRERPQMKDFRHVAEVPKTVIDQALIEGWYHDPVKWKQWLNDPDNAAFRVWGGRV